MITDDLYNNQPNIFPLLRKVKLSNICRVSQKYKTQQVCKNKVLLHFPQEVPEITLIFPTATVMPAGPD